MYNCGGGVGLSDGSEPESFESNGITYTVKDEPSEDGTPGTVSAKNKNYITSKEEGYRLIIPDYVTNDGKKYAVVEIEKYGFEKFQVTCEIVELPNTLETINEGAFKNSSFKSITIPGSVKEIRTMAFMDCTSLKTLVIKNGLTYIGSNAFSNCTSLVSVTIPQSVKSIANDAFLKCSNLTNVTLNEGLTSIGAGIFGYCEKLKTLTVPDSLTDSLTTSNWCGLLSNSSLNDIIIKESNTNYTSIDGVVYTKDMSTLVYCPPMKTNVDVQDGVKQIGQAREQEARKTLGFENCRALVSVELPDGLERIEEEAFNQCISLKEITIPDSVVYIGKDAFYNCESLGKVVFPANLKTLGDGAFNQCKLLNNIHLPYGLESIGEYAFVGCIALERIEIPDTVNTIGKGTFKNCTKLLGVDIPDGIAEIESGLFQYCKSLRTFVIPEGVESIESEAFDKCEALTSIQFPNSIKNIAVNAFSIDGFRHSFINSDGTTVYGPSVINEEKMRGKTYVGISESHLFTYKEYIKSDSDGMLSEDIPIRYNIRYYTNGGYNDFANPPDITKNESHKLAVPEDCVE